MKTYGAAAAQLRPERHSPSLGSKFPALQHAFDNLRYSKSSSQRESTMTKTVLPMLVIVIGGTPFVVIVGPFPSQYCFFSHNGCSPSLIVPVVIPSVAAVPMPAMAAIAPNRV